VQELAKVYLKGSYLMSKLKSSKTNYAVPGPRLRQKEFEKMIRDAQKGPFYSIQTFRRNLKMESKVISNAESNFIIISSRV
jgi:hypothetical protein